jgi:hypothetical protein
MAAITGFPLDAGLLCVIGAMLKDTIKGRPRIERIYFSIVRSRCLHVFPQPINLYFSSHLCKQERDCDIIPERCVPRLCNECYQGSCKLVCWPHLKLPFASLLLGELVRTGEG